MIGLLNPLQDVDNGTVYPPASAETQKPEVGEMKGPLKKIHRGDGCLCASGLCSPVSPTNMPKILRLVSWDLCPVVQGHRALVEVYSQNKAAAA